MVLPWIPTANSVHKPWLKQNQPGYQQRHVSQLGGSGLTLRLNSVSGIKRERPWGGGGQHQQVWPVGGQQQSWSGHRPWQPSNRPAWRPGRAPQALPSSYAIDEAARFTGSVQFYHKWKGYGFIEPAEQGLVPGNKIFIHWSGISSDDRYPFLVQGLEVEFSMQRQRDNKRWGGITVLRAHNCTLIGGMPICIQDDQDAQEKAFVGGQHLRYTGILKFFSPRHGFGYVKMDEGYDVDASVPMEMRVATAEVNAGGRQPVRMQDLAVEFGIWKTPRGKYEVYNMTLPGGHPLTQDAVENRTSIGAQMWSGEVVMWRWEHGWGFVKPSPLTPLPARVMQKLLQQVQAARARGRHIREENLLYFRKGDVAPGVTINRGSRVTFQLYIDDKGAGACDVQT